MTRRNGVLVGAFVLAILAALVFASQFSLSALPEPGKTETYLAGKLRRALIHRASRRENIPPAPADRAASIEEGDKLYGTECGDCHGLDGHSPTDEGRWMYPRSANLISPETQQYSDRELFTIIRNGIRLSGMPAFGRVETDEHIWNLVHYLRKLPSGPD